MSDKPFDMSSFWLNFIVSFSHLSNSMNLSDNNNYLALRVQYQSCEAQMDNCSFYTRHIGMSLLYTSYPLIKLCCDKKWVELLVTKFSLVRGPLIFLTGSSFVPFTYGDIEGRVLSTASMSLLRFFHVDNDMHACIHDTDLSTL